MPLAALGPIREIQEPRARSRPLHEIGNSTLGDRRGMDAIELRKVLVQVRLTQRSDRSLVRPLAVPAGNFLYHVHARNHLAERGKAHFVELRVVPGVDEKLRSARIFSGGSKGDVAGFIALRNGIVLESRFAP